MTKKQIKQIGEASEFWESFGARIGWTVVGFTGLSAVTYRDSRDRTLAMTYSQVKDILRAMA